MIRMCCCYTSYTGKNAALGCIIIFYFQEVVESFYLKSFINNEIKYFKTLVKHHWLLSVSVYLLYVIEGNKVGLLKSKKSMLRNPVVYYATENQADNR